eukprot:2686330-Amphidinium_carterae.1
MIRNEKPLQLQCSACAPSFKALCTLHFVSACAQSKEWLWRAFIGTDINDSFNSAIISEGHGGLSELVIPPTAEVPPPRDKNHYKQEFFGIN